MREMEFRSNHRDDPEVVDYLFKLIKSGPIPLVMYRSPAESRGGGAATIGVLDVLTITGLVGRLTGVVASMRFLARARAASMMGIT